MDQFLDFNALECQFVSAAMGDDCGLKRVNKTYYYVKLIRQLTMKDR